MGNRAKDFRAGVYDLGLRAACAGFRAQVRRFFSRRGVYGLKLTL